MLANLYSEMGCLIAEIEQKPASIEVIKASLKCSETMLAGFKKTPDIIVAQPLLYKSNLSYVENLSFNSSVYLILLCNANKVNDVCTQQLICGILTLYVERKDHITTHFCGDSSQNSPQNGVNKNALNNSRRKLLATYHQHIWLDVYALSNRLLRVPKTNQDWPNDFSKLQRLVYLAHLLSVLMTHNPKQKPKSFAQTIKQLCQHCPNGWIDDLESLLQYPGTIPPGTVIRQKSATPALTLSVGNDKLLVVELPRNRQATKTLNSVFAKNVVSVSGVQKVSGISIVEKWWGQPWLDKYTEDNQYFRPNTSLFRLDRPPAVLLEVQEHLNSDDIDIDKLALQISEEPYFADYLRQTATISNRNKLPIQRIKHGLMMHGYERTNSMLIQQLLLSRLNQSYFPLQQDFLQFTHLRAQIAATLAESTDDLTGENASVLACFSSAGLFTQPSLKSHTRWQRNNECHFDIQSLFEFSNAKNLHNHAIKLAQAWQQPKHFITCLSQQRQLPNDITANIETRKLTAVLGLSLVGAIQVFFDESHLDTVTHSYIKQAFDLLQLEQVMFANITKQALSICHTYRAI